MADESQSSGWAALIAGALAGVAVIARVVRDAWSLVRRQRRLEADMPDEGAILAELGRLNIRTEQLAARVAQLEAAPPALPAPHVHADAGESAPRPANREANL